MSTSAAELHVGDVGTEILVSLVDDGDAVDLTALLEAVVKIHRPDHTVVELSAAVLGDPTLGQVVAIATSETFSVRGVYEIQAYIRFSTGRWHSQKAFLSVFPVVS